jgi:hypothetical protein
LLCLRTSRTHVSEIVDSLSTADGLVVATRIEGQLADLTGEPYG